MCSDFSNYPTEHDRELLYGEPKLRELRPEGMRLYEWLGLGLLQLLCVVVPGGVGLVTFAIALDMWSDRDALYLTVPVAASGIAALACGGGLLALVIRFRDRLQRRREAMTIARATQQISENVTTRLEEAVAGDPTIEGFRRLANEYLWEPMHDADAALRVLCEAIEKFPTEARFHLALGQAYAMKGELGAAVECFGRCAELDSGLESKATWELDLIGGIVRRHYAPGGSTYRERVPPADSYVAG